MKKFLTFWEKTVRTKERTFSKKVYLLSALSTRLGAVDGDLKLFWVFSVRFKKAGKLLCRK